MPRKILKFIANTVIICGFLLLARIIYSAAMGTLATRFFPESAANVATMLMALCLSLPVPLHIISVGMILQRRWLSPTWSRIAMPAAVISGCWLGAALAVKILIMS